MTDTMFGCENEQWVCPNDRQLALRAKLHTGWSIHTFQSERQRKAQTIEKTELDLIMSVLQRAEQLEIIEQHRIGRLVERLENMRRSAMGNGLSQCLLCGEVFGLLGSTSVLCLDCCMKVCTKCGIETAGSQKRAQWLCKICSEQREVWKRSGAWFYKALPKHIRPIKDSILDNRKSVIEREEQLPVARSAPVSYTWAQSKVYVSESDGSDDELSECSSDRKTFTSETDQRRDSEESFSLRKTLHSESSGGQVQTPLQPSITGPTPTTESSSSLVSERSGSSFKPGLEEDVMDHSPPLPTADGLCMLDEEVTGVDPVSSSPSAGERKFSSNLL
ncbi:rab effector Noc2 isoform X6 [Megalobrama amblycephala]|uniref:rab effector Noc2 isoform X6 n=1 Tax=Megalobrama amblycephala TaxID=75352 RepID=UPI002014582A|nr:rab effector Noc2 isoform X6 [Megalobrama amblycephala]